MVTKGLKQHSMEAFFIGRSGLNSANIQRLSVRDFTKFPGPGLKRNGNSSGEEFREGYLIPAYNEVIKKPNHLLVVDLDGTAGYGPSFVREAFGGLVRSTKDKKIKERLVIISKDDPLLLRRIWEWIDQEIDRIE